MLLWLHVILALVQGILAVLVGYLLLLTAAAHLAPKKTRPLRAAPTRRFFIFIPAHNEEKLLPDLLNNLAQLDYPDALREVCVIADNCSDQTAAVARQWGVTVLERTDAVQRGKGYALQWAWHKMETAVAPQDALLILDADSVVSPNFLRVMDARLNRGERVIQSYYAVRQPQQSWNVGLRAAALAVLHYVRPSGRTLLGGSAGLKGNGMVFAADLFRRHGWTAALTEDIELHMALLLSGERVTFAPDAVVAAEMPQTLAASQSQHVRWERGRLEMARRYVPRLLRSAWRALRTGHVARVFPALDAVMEHLIPPFSLLAAMTGTALLAALLLPAGTAQAWKSANVVLATALVLGQLIYLLSGLRLVKAPRRVYFALLYTPIFILWKVWLYVRILLGFEQQGWVRTARNQS